MSKQDQLEWEARWARPAAAAAFVAALLLLAQVILLQTVVEDRAGIEAIPDFLLSVDENPAMLLGARGAQALASLLLIGVFLYLFRAVQARAGGVPKWFIYMIVAGPALYAVGLILGAVGQVDVASDFAGGEPIRGNAGDDRADRLLEDNANAGVFALNFAGSIATAFLFVMLPLRARRVGLLSPFIGILGVVTGALLVLQIVPLVPVIIEAFWLGAIGSLYLGNWPGGRGPAWETGEAEPWPTAAQRRGLEPQPGAEQEQSGSLLGPPETKEPEPSEPEPVPERPSSRKRRRKR
ncbi:MAG: hypothetical protein ABWY95_07990 [Thermoleophilaceae bacterium]